MWMMSDNDGGEFNIPDSFNGRKLRPLMPRPTATATTNNSATTNPPFFSHIHGHDILALDHHLATVAEQSKKELSTQQVVVSSRWNPTPEQLQTLEELYRRGTRTPSAEKIQHITAQLRRYGKIEGKNVFYWFQNHKARERQKRRRQLESASEDEFRDIESIERKELGVNGTRFEVEQTKNWAATRNKTVSIQMAAKAAVSECRTDGWVQFDEEELQQRRSLVERNATWQMMQLSCSPPTHFINSTTNTTTAATIPATVRMMDPQLITTRDLNIFTAPHREELNHSVNVGNDAVQTLQLFPIESGAGDHNAAKNEEKISVAAMNTNFTPNYQFFEFIPLKN